MKILSKTPIIIIALVVILVGCFSYSSYKVKTPLSKEGVDQVFVVAPGDGVFDIGPKLQNEVLISHKIWFYEYVLLRGWGGKLQAGEYVLSSAMSVAEISNKIAKGNIIETENDLSVTFPEGFKASQMDSKLAESGLIEMGELTTFAKNYGIVINSGQASLISKVTAQQTDNIYSLEGYLFPDTYRFGQNFSVEQIAQKMIDNFNAKLDAQLKAEIDKQNKSIHDIIIMASILERELRTDQDRKIASGIFWQRIADSYPLQACSTIAYALGVDKWRYSEDETKIQSPYNTYQNIGLPPGPISNPGLSAIKAAIYPQQTDYYFFLSKPDGETVFSKTFEEHNVNIAKYLD